MEEETQIEVSFENIKESDKNIIIALLADAGFEGFDESGNGLKAYIQKNLFEEDEVKQLAGLHSVAYQVQEIKPQNWNAVWESHFEPVMIDDFVGVRAHFHEAIPAVQYEIVITPKMSFGTGHHATTTMMMQQMRDIDFSGKRVLDFGTGTGILAILAEKLGAVEILAIDNDAWSIENSLENINRNDCHRIQVQLADSIVANDAFDVILANINRNVILENFAALNDRIYEKGYLVLSGLLAEDEAIILQEAGKYPLRHKNTRQLGQWISLLFSR